MRLIASDADNAQDRTMAGVTVTQPHLVVLRKDNVWSDRKFICVPEETFFSAAYAQGIETTKGTDTLDTAGLLNLRNLVESRLNDPYSATGTVWKEGRKPLFCSAWRGYDAVSRRESDYSFYSRSAVACKFNLKNIPLALASSFSASIRAWIPSATMCDTGSSGVGSFYCPDGFAQLAGGWPFSRATLDVGFSKTLHQTTSPSQSDTGFVFDHINIGNGCNNGKSDVLVKTREYSPDGAYDTSAAYSQFKCAYSVYATGDTPSEYYHDFLLSDTQMNFLKKNSGTVWMIAKFSDGDLFRQGTSGSGVLHWRSGWNFFIERLELVLTVRLGML